MGRETVRKGLGTVSENPLLFVLDSLVLCAVGRRVLGVLAKQWDMPEKCQIPFSVPPPKERT